MPRVSHILLLALGVSAAALWFVPAPGDLTAEVWHLFLIFALTIGSVVVGALPILVASILALAAAVLTGTLAPEVAYSGFSEGFILLIVAAFLVAQGVVKSGLGRRISLLIIRRFGRSTLGLGYSMLVTDLLIAPAFPSNTARSGVLYPIVAALARDSGSRPDAESRGRVGRYLMMNSMAGLSISSALWFTAMAANPVGARVASGMGITIDFGSWLIASIVPCLTAAVVLPWALYRLIPPTVKKTPEAPAAARALKEMGAMSRHEWITAAVFVGMVVLWALSSTLGLDKTAVAFAGLGVLMVAGVFTVRDMKGQGDALSTLIWFAVLYTLSAQLDEMGFMTFVGEAMAQPMEGLPWQLVYVLLTVAYVVIHYLFVSQTAQMLALFGVFLKVGIDAGVPGGLMAMQLLFATNYNSAITPQGSSANILFASSGYLRSSEMYRVGGVATAINTLIFLVVGTGWMVLTGASG